MRPLRLTSAALTLAAATILATAGVATTGSSVAAPASVTWSAADAVMAGTSTASTAAGYKFSTVIEGKPVRWNPCVPIHWQFRSTGGAPTHGQLIVRAAVARVAYLTGTRWVEDRPTTATPTSKWLPTSTAGIRPVLIGWTDGAHSDLLRGRPAAVLGVTRTAYFGGTVDGVAVGATKAAVIALDRTDKLPLTGAVSWKTTLLHELGHAMGLDHVGNGSQIMYPVLGRRLVDFNTGDRAGLARLGRTAGCVDIGY